MDATKVLIAFYSRNGSTEALAKEIGEGARATGADVRLRRVSDIASPEVMTHAPGWAENSARMISEHGAPTEADAKWADAIIFGTPTRFGNGSSELKAFIDSLGGLWSRASWLAKPAARSPPLPPPMAGMKALCFLYTTRWRIWG